MIEIEIALLNYAAFWEIHHEFAIILAFILDKSKLKRFIMRCLRCMAAACKQFVSTEAFNVILIIFAILLEELVSPLAYVFVEEFLRVRALASNIRFMLNMSRIKSIHSLYEPKWKREIKNSNGNCLSPASESLIFSLPRAIIIMWVCTTTSEAAVMLFRLQWRLGTFKRFFYWMPWKHIHIETTRKSQCCFIFYLQIRLHSYHKRHTCFLEDLPYLFRMASIEKD